MKILRASSDYRSALIHQSALQEKGHIVMLCKTGEECLRTYSEQTQRSRSMNSPSSDPFDTVLLDCEIKDMDALELGKRILTMNPKQRLVLESENIKETISRLIKEFDTPAQIIQKPITDEILISSLEDEDMYSELRKFKTEFNNIKKAIEINEE